MSARDRGFGFKIVTALFVVALLGLLLGLTYDLATSHTERKFRAVQNSSEYSAGTEKRVKEACIGLSGGDLIACVQKEVEATNEHKRSVYDLTAQQDMDEWSFWLLWVSVASVAVSALAVILVWRTLDVTRETLVATQDMARDTREIGEAQVRAYITVDSCTITPHPSQDDVKWDVSFVVRNCGQSPARRLTSWVSIDNETQKASTIVPDIAAGGTHVHDTSVCCSDDPWFQPGSDTDVITFVTVYVSFEDVFSERGDATTETADFVGVFPLIGGDPVRLKPAGRVRGDVMAGDVPGNNQS